MKPTIILEIANNHMGNVSHGKKIITEFNKITKKFKNQIKKCKTPRWGVFLCPPRR